MKQEAIQSLGTLSSVWRCAQVGIIIFPLFPALGGLLIGFFILLIYKQKFPQIIKNPLNWGLALLSIWLIITSCLAVNPTEAFLGLANFLPFFIFFAALNVLIKEISQLRQLAWILVIPSLPITILGLGQIFAGWTTSPLILKVLGWELVSNGNPSGRMASVFMYANILAAYLLIVFILGLGLWIDTYQARKKSRTKYQGWILLFLTVVVIGNGISLILTSSRNGWAIAFIACLAFALYLGWYWLVLGVGTIASSIIWASFGPSLGRDWIRSIVPAYFWARLSDELYPNRNLALLRKTQWLFAWDMTKERPWTGWGLRSFTSLYEAQMGVWLGHPHNLFLMFTSEIGIPATVLFLSWVGWIITQAVLVIVNWSTIISDQLVHQEHRDKLILFTYLIAFGSCSLFNLLDVTIFDLRVNTLGWLLLAAISGVSNWRF